MKWLKFIWEMFKVFFLFTGFTILFYYAIMWLNEEYRIHNQNEEPRGKAVKVLSPKDDREDSRWLDRLILFYLNGE
ncbi:YqzK family protein [Fervidibacillus halotolerans]|uniref:YqzK family protein n=1 Tax=Fervidibacillus halotolerans TaxID=2980027 RepID=A0A9E8M247_9BACI|nr:YqzK family protein [Fervidibacillus halotolerans]WAA13821.1 YqzK family protein [Fervidibacillus halotolerans]